MDVGKLPFFQLMKHHFHYTGQRQRVLADNIANVDTPGYKSQDIMSFDEKNFGRMLAHKLNLETTNVRHMTGSDRMGAFRQEYDGTPWEIARSGNTVILEDQIMRMNDNSGAHRLTSDVYSKQLGMIRTTLQLSQR